MTVSEFLKTVRLIRQGEIWIEFKEDKKDAGVEFQRLSENTTEEKAKQVIERASGYTLQEVRLNENIVIISAVRIQKRMPMPEKKQDEKRAEQKQAIAEELERLEQAVAVLIETIVAPFRRSGRRADGKRAGDSGRIKERAGSSSPDDTDIQERRGGEETYGTKIEIQGKQLPINDRGESICREKP